MEGDFFGEFHLYPQKDEQQRWREERHEATSCSGQMNAMSQRATSVPMNPAVPKDSIRLIDRRSIVVTI